MRQEPPVSPPPSTSCLLPIWLLLEPQVRITWYLFYCVWFISLSNVLKVLPCCSRCKNFLRSGGLHSIWYVNITFCLSIHLLINTGLFLCFDYCDKCHEHRCTNICWSSWSHLFWIYTQKWSCCILFIFSRNICTVFHSSCAIWHSHHNAPGSCFCAPSATLPSFFVLNESQPSRCKFHLSFFMYYKSSQFYIIHSFNLHLSYVQ